MKTGKRGQLKIIKNWLEKKGLYICFMCRGEGQIKILINLSMNILKHLNPVKFVVEQE